jgi:hypothetical protein
MIARASFPRIPVDHRRPDSGMLLVVFFPSIIGSPEGAMGPTSAVRPLACSLQSDFKSWSCAWR